MIDLILIGGGGHCKSCIEVIENSEMFNIKAILDKNEKLNTKVIGNYLINGTDEDFSKYIFNQCKFFIAIGSINNSNIRRLIYNKLKSEKAELTTIISKNSFVSKYSIIGNGTIVMQQSIVNSGAVVGNNCILNNKSLIEHDVMIGDNTHISTGAIVNGECKIGKDVFVGSNTVIKNNISVCDLSIIGAGSVVLSDIIDPGVFAGNPAKRIK